MKNTLTIPLFNNLYVLGCVPHRITNHDPLDDLKMLINRCGFFDSIEIYYSDTYKKDFDFFKPFVEMNPVETEDTFSFDYDWVRWNINFIKNLQFNGAFNVIGYIKLNDVYILIFREEVSFAFSSEWIELTEKK